MWGFWKGLRQHVLLGSLRKGLLRRRRLLKPGPDSFQKARSVAFLFDATDADVAREVATYAEKLRRKGKEILLLGFQSTDPVENPHPFPCFHSRDADWVGRPRGLSVQEWLARPVDFLIHVATRPLEPLEYLAGLTPAALRVGPATGLTDCYDLMLDLPPAATTQTFFREMEHLLGFIKIGHDGI